MRRLEFIGTVRTNKSQYAQEMVVPGRDDLLLKPEDWPMQPVAANVAIEVSGFPQGFEEIGEGEGLEKLDVGEFRPELVIPQRKISGSTLKPDADHPTRGFALVWRAEIQATTAGQETACWMIRIVGSAPTALHLAAEEDLRLSLCDGAAVKVTIWEAESKRRPKTPQEIIPEWCEAALGVEEDYGPEKAMGYLIGEKFLNFLEVAERDREWRRAIPSFVDEIKAIFEPWQLAGFLNTARRLGALGHVASEEEHRLLSQAMGESDQLREDARNLMLLEWAKELLLNEEG